MLPISDNYNEYAEKISNLLNFSDIRGLVDDRSEKVGKKIRDAELAKVPFMLIIGEKEVSSEMVSVRKRGEGDLGAMRISDFEKLVKKEIEKELSQEL